MLPMLPRMSTTPMDNQVACFGECRRCGATHCLPVAGAREHALALMDTLSRARRLDFDVPEAASDPKLSFDHLFPGGHGNMFGVLECENAGGETVVLRAFSSLRRGIREVEGWVPPILSADSFYGIVLPGQQKIEAMTAQLAALEPASADHRELLVQRRRISQALLREMQSLYRFHNFRGELRPLREALWPDRAIPGGVGECCAPKLLDCAARQALRPRGLAEFYWGDSDTKQAGAFYPSCESRCRPILGFMLCGLEEVSEPLLEIVHEDPDFVVVDKPSGLLSVPGRGPEKRDCVASRVRTLYPGCIEQPAVHRLDMDTSGLLVVARTREAHRRLSIQFRRRETSKRYVALLDGELGAEKGTIELPFRLDIDNRPYQILDPVHGKLGITHWERLLVENGVTRVAFWPVTGRTHQLRVHAAHEQGLGIPIVGDPLYGNGTGPAQLKLHACELGFRHPSSDEALRFASQPPF